MNRRKALIGSAAAFVAAVLGKTNTEAQSAIGNIRSIPDVPNLELDLLVSKVREIEGGWQFLLERVAQDDDQIKFVFKRRPWPEKSVYDLTFDEVDAMILLVSPETVDRLGVNRVNDHIFHQFRRFQRESLDKLHA